MASPAQPHIDWWEEKNFSLVEMIYFHILSLGSESTLGSPDTTDKLLTDSDIDSVVKRAYGKLDLQFPESIKWRDDKRKILEGLFSMHRGRSTIQSPPISHVTTSKDAGPWGVLPIEQPVPPTPETPATLPHPPSLPGTPSTSSDHAIKARDPALRSPPGQLKAASPGNFASSGDSRRRKSSASMQGERPGKRSRGLQNHVCPVCERKYPYPSKLRDHMKSHDSEKPLPCPQKDCNKVFKREREVKAHLKSVHRVDSFPITPPSSVPSVLPPQSPVPPSVSLPIAPTPPSAVSPEDPDRIECIFSILKRESRSESPPTPSPWHASARGPKDGHELANASERNPNINRPTIDVNTGTGTANTRTMGSPSDHGPDQATPAEESELASTTVSPKSESPARESSSEMSEYHLSSLQLKHNFNQ
jgi:hypothetical protein